MKFSISHPATAEYRFCGIHVANGESAEGKYWFTLPDPLHGLMLSSRLRFFSDLEWRTISDTDGQTTGFELVKQIYNIDILDNPNDPEDTSARAAESVLQALTDRRISDRRD